MKAVAITGSTRGIGLGMAHEFLKRGHAVVINGRSQDSVDKAISELSTLYDATRIFGFACDIRDHALVQMMWESSKAHFGKVDIWVNNAGIAEPYQSFLSQSPETISMVMDINITGLMNCSRIVVNGMIAQGFGHLYNMYGMGSTGRQQPGLSIYGTSKFGLKYFTDALIEETKDTPIIVGSLSPGMVLTDMLKGDQQKDKPDVRRIFNILAERVSTIAPFLVERILKNKKHGANIRWLTTSKMMWRFLSAPFIKRDLFSE